MTKGENLGGWIYLLLQTFLVPLVLVIINEFLPDPFSDSEMNFIFFALNFICVTAICGRFLKNSIKDLFKRPAEVLCSAGIGFVLYFILNIVVSYLVLYLKPDFINENDSSIAELTQDNFGLISIGTVLLVPTVEEVFYRGLVFRGIYNRCNWAAYLVSASVFSAIHIVGYIGIYDTASLGIAFLQYLPGGLCLAWSYARADNIFAPIIIHTAINQIAISSMR